MKKKLTLHRTAVRPLTDVALAHVQGGTLYYYQPIGNWTALSVVVSSVASGSVGVSGTPTFACI